MLLLGIHLAIGTHNGDVQIWDTVNEQKIRVMPGHNARVGALAWSDHLLASGSRDRVILLRDVRAPQQTNDTVSKLAVHKQEVCGLKFSPDENYLASGGNDNKLLIWNAKMATSNRLLHKFSDHSAAVKAIAWSPHQSGLIASGGGTADRCIRFFNAHTGARLNFIDTGSQVCNLIWAKNVNEICSTHGYSLNQIIIWRYPSMNKIATLQGHTQRVIYLASSPDQTQIVTGAGDETLRFYSIFPASKNASKSSILSPNGSDLR